MSDRHDELSPVKRALAEVREARVRLAASDAERHEPIAIIGIGCRFPGGANDPESYWTLLRDGVDAVGEVPASRWDTAEYYDPNPAVPGKMATRTGAFIGNLDRFDHTFFGISPREAASMDPQQRLVLEVAWEALEHAGLPADRLMGQPAGVFVGASGTDYLQLLLRRDDPAAIDAYVASGGALSVIAGRLAYFLGTQGPTIVVDTACSSSLVAVHHACRSLRQRESQLAIAAGVSVVLLPELNINFSQARMLSPDGRCKTFDAAADGYGRGEGCGVVILKRLSDARADGDRVLAVVRGSAVNQDGRSSGLTVPNGIAQEAVIAAALADARLEPADVDYVEAHGTGTSLGDPIELLALARAFGAGRDTHAPLLVGSVKTNIGHLEAAAGIAGLIKAALSLERNELPPSLHFRTPTPHVDWPHLPLRVVDRTTRLEDQGRPHRAGVSSFGFSGTNAHVVLESASPQALDGPPAVTHGAHVLALSARTARALAETVTRFTDHLGRGEPVDVAAVCWSAATGRQHFSVRLAVVAATHEELVGELAATRVFDSDTASNPPPRVAFAFSGQGAPFGDVSRDLYDGFPAFRAAIDRCVGLLDPATAPAVEDVLRGRATAETFGNASLVQPALFAFQYALAEQWQSWGIRPDAVVGHSLGEYAAACVAGAMTLEDALCLVAARGRLTQSLPISGSMAAAFADEATVREALATDAATVTLGAVNAADSVVISGDADAVARVRARLSERRVESRALNVTHAFHSPLVDPLLDALQAEAATRMYAVPQVAWASTVIGRFFAEDERPTAEYWRRHTRDTVRFAATLGLLTDRGVTHVVEIGPHATLCGLGRRNGGSLRWIPSAGAPSDHRRQLLSALGHLYTDGATIDWTNVATRPSGGRVTLPTYPFERHRHWIESPAARRGATAPRHADESWKRSSDAAKRQAESAPFDLHLATIPAKWSALRALSLATMESALRRLGAFTVADSSHTVDDVLHRCGIQPTFRPLIERWLDHLASTGRLTGQGDRFTAPRPLASQVPSDVLGDATALLADYPEMLEYFASCSNRLDDVLTGRASALDTLFPGGSLAIAEGLYGRSAVARYFNEIVSSVVGTLAAVQTPGRRLRVLEVGGGTGGTTASVLRTLDPTTTDYVFTDVGPTFLSRAAERFGDAPFVTFDTFDLEDDAAVTRMGAGSFDVVIAANVLHATRDLSITLKHVQELLSPGGFLVAVESTDYHIWLDVTMALVAGWQRFDDAWRQRHPLLAADRWKAILDETGFAHAGVWPLASSAASILGQHVLVAQTVADSANVVAAPSAGALKFAPVPLRAAAEPVLSRRLAGSTPLERRAHLLELVRAEVTRVLRLPPEQSPSSRQRLMELGVDSLMAVELRDRLRSALALEQSLSATLVFDYPTIAAIADHLSTLVEPAPAAVAEFTSERAETIAMLDDDAVAELVDARLRDLGM